MTRRTESELIVPGAPSPAALGQEITSWVTARTEAILTRFYAGPVLPRFMAGHILDSSTHIDLMHLLGQLHALGATEFAGATAEDWIRRLLPTIDGERTQTFGSLALAETLLEWGPFAGNPLLAELSVAQRANVAEACDTSHIYKADGTIGEWSANYWMVLARAESARQRLGLLRDTAVLDAAVAHCRQVLLQSSDDYFDDSATKVGRYDHYMTVVVAVLRPLASHLPAAPYRAWLARETRLLETLAMENGAGVAWGRSIGMLSILDTISRGACALDDGLSDDPGRIFELVAHAAAQVPALFHDDLVAAHRHRMQDGYRGPQRLLQMTLGCLDVLASSARVLRTLPAPPPSRGPLFPPRDELIRFDSRNAGVWMFRNEHMAFQLPFVSAWLGADYVPWPHSPGLFENPVDCPLRFGVPVVLQDGKAFGPGERPASVVKVPGGLTLTYDSLMEEVSGGWMPNAAWRRIPAKLSLTWRVEGDALHFEQRLVLDRPADGMVVSIPQAGAPLSVEIVDCSVSFSQNTVDVSGIALYRSFWSQLTAVHQIHLQPATEVILRFAVSATRPHP